MYDFLSRETNQITYHIQPFKRSHTPFEKHKNVWIFANTKNPQKIQNYILPKQDVLLHIKYLLSRFQESDQKTREQYINQIQSNILDSNNNFDFQQLVIFQLIKAVLPHL
eukprot:TRINITY_DN31422_c0_g4_i2.p4 TRINITY_DN31422_c0_g4~~TRINITY_DN31422_c0_g4_i2.p4  ORF type:complete len:110 (+),score=0.68 TRINITY_DN31422_c0_g4_i2:461-790(+)